MADDPGRFDAEIDLDVTFNEFDEELGVFSEKSREYNAEKLIADGSGQDTKPIPCRASNGNVFVESGVTNETTDGAGNSTRVEEGEISSSSEGEDVEKMDYDEESGKELKSLSQNLTKSAEESEKSENVTFSSPNFVFKECDKKESLEEELASCTPKMDYDAESAMLSMESDNSMDDQSWKRHKRARLEQVSHGTDEANSKDRKDEQRKKTRGGRKKRKRPLRSHRVHESQHRSSTYMYQYSERESGNEKLFKPLTVTSEDSERTVAREIASKLNESKTMLIERVVTCIGCEKAIKLFKDTQEVERHGGMRTKDGDRRRTSGGVFFVLLKHRYVTKEQSKWIFALENELLKKKAKEEQQRIKELHKKNVADLRLKLKDRDMKVEKKTLQELK